MIKLKFLSSVVDFIAEFAVDQDIFENELLSWQTTGLRLMGLVFAKDSFKIFHFLRGIFVTFACFALVLAQAKASWIQIDDIDNLSIPLGGFIAFSNGFIRIINYYYYHNEYNKLLTALNNGVKQIILNPLPVELEIFKNYIRYIKILDYFLALPLTSYLTYAFLESIHFLVFSVDEWTALLNGSKNDTIKLPVLFITYPMNALSGSSFSISFIAPYLISLIALPSLIILHTFNAAVMRYISFRLDIVNYKVSHIQDLKTLRTSDYKEANVDDFRNWLRLAFIECFHEVAEIRNFTKNYERISAMVFFIESATASASFCVLLYVISIDFTAGYGIYICWYGTIISILWIYFWHANQISLKSNQLTLSLYSSTWYDFPLGIRKDLKLFMGITLRPIAMKTGFIDMNTSSFLTIMRLSYSYFTLLKNAAY